jgi:hypothetical protein
MFKLVLIFCFHLNYFVASFDVQIKNSTDSVELTPNSKSFDIVCYLRKVFNTMKLKPGEKLKFIFNPFETFPATDDVREVITTPKFLIANILVVSNGKYTYTHNYNYFLQVVHVIAKVILWFVVMIFLIYNNQFNSLF